MLKSILVLVGIATSCPGVLAYTSSPAAVFKLVADRIVNITATSGCDNAIGGNTRECAFGKWSYGPAIIHSELLRASTNAELGVDYTDFVGARLEYWLRKEGSTAYNITHNVSMPWGYSIGDRVGLYPIVYLDRGDLSDIELALAAAKQYVLKWPRRWTDGTISRDTGDAWPGEHDDPTHASFIWGDDAFMGLTLISRLAAVADTGNGTRSISAADSVAFRAMAGAQHRLLVEHLAHTDTANTASASQGSVSRVINGDGLYFHGQNAADGHVSCCKWGRANGWMMMAHIEVLSGLEGDRAGASATAYAAARAALVAHAQAVVAVQPKAPATDGRWHQLLNDTSTYLETSCTAMFTFALARAVKNGWLERQKYDSAIKRGWAGLVKAVQPNGTVTGICNGFGIHPSAESYAHCSTSYYGSAPGLGSVLRAAHAMHDYLQGS